MATSTTGTGGIDTVHTYDVVVVGYGPTGATAAALLGHHGLSVLVVDQCPNIHPLPRAVHIDSESMALLLSLGLDTAAFAHPMTHLSFLNDQLRPLLTFPRGRDSSGLYSDYLINQPLLEQALRARVAQFPNVRVLTGLAVTSITDSEYDSESSTAADNGIVMVHTDIGLTMRGRFLLGCDGAKSTVRHQLAIPLLSLSSLASLPSNQWLVIDGELPVKVKAKIGLSELGVNQVCSARQPMTIVSLSGANIRIEINLVDPPHSLLAPASARVKAIGRYWTLITSLVSHLLLVLWSLVAPLVSESWALTNPDTTISNYHTNSGTDPGADTGNGDDRKPPVHDLQHYLPVWFPVSSLKVHRQSVYSVRGLLAQTFQSQSSRCFLLGDAAHQLPPFLGAGLCLGLRDSANLCWKLSYIVKHSVQNHRLMLRSYDNERRNEARSYIVRSLKIAQLVSMTDPVLSAVNHWVMANIVNRSRWLKSIFSAMPKRRVTLANTDRVTDATSCEALVVPSVVGGVRVHSHGVDDRFSIIGVNQCPLSLITSDPDTDSVHHHCLTLTSQQLAPWLQASSSPNDVSVIVVRPEGTVFGLYAHPARFVSWRHYFYEVALERLGRRPRVWRSAGPFPVLADLRAKLGATRSSAVLAN